VDIDARDCRLEGFRSSRNALWFKATYLPTGTVVEFQNGLNKRDAMNELQMAVNKAMSIEEI
jgi:hypothetical protein